MEQRFETFTTQIAKISRYIRKIKSEEMAEFNLKSPHVSCLYYLYKRGDSMTATELCEICEEDKGAISRSIDFLEREGYIECKSNTEKRYKSPLFLTAKGKKVSHKIADKVDGVLAKSSLGVSEKDRQTFYNVLNIIANNLQNISNKGDKK